MTPTNYMDNFEPIVKPLVRPYQFDLLIHGYGDSISGGLYRCNFFWWCHQLITWNAMHHIHTYCVYIHKMSDVCISSDMWVGREVKRGQTTSSFYGSFCKGYGHFWVTSGKISEKLSGEDCGEMDHIELNQVDSHVVPLGCIYLWNV